MSDTTARAISAWIECNRLADERDERYREDLRKMALVLRDVRDALHDNCTCGCVEVVEEKIRERGMVIHWNALWE